MALVCRSRGRKHDRSTFQRKLRLEPLECRRVLSMSVGDFVWNDVDGNGLQDAGGAGVSGAVVELREGGVLRQTAVTDGTGHFLLPDWRRAPPISCSSFPPVGYRFTGKDAGDDARDSDVDADGLTGAFSLSNADDFTLDGGLLRTVSRSLLKWATAWKFSRRATSVCRRLGPEPYSPATFTLPGVLCRILALRRHRPATSLPSHGGDPAGPPRRIR